MVVSDPWKGNAHPEDEVAFEEFDDYSGGRTWPEYRRKYPDDPVRIDDFPMTWGRFLGI